MRAASVGGKPVRRYRVAVADFLARGGDRYVVLSEAPGLVSSEDGPELIGIVVEVLERGASP